MEDDVKKQMKDTIIEIIYLFSSIFMIGILLWLLIYSLRFWIILYPSLDDLNSKAYFLGSIVAIATVLGEWIQGRINAIIRSPLLNKKKGRLMKHGRRE